MAKAYDNRTPKGRKKIDEAVEGKLPASGLPGLSRGDIADALKMDARMVSAALRRLVASGKAQPGGRSNAPTYAKAGA